MTMMGPAPAPEPGTERYKEQVERILKLLRGAKAKTQDEVERLLMLYILDMSYARPAICEAETIYRKEAFDG